MQTFAITQGDQEPPLVVGLRNADGTAYVPANGSTAVFKMVRRTDQTTVTGVAFIGGTGGDQLTYYWASGDTAAAGLYDAQFTVTLPNTHEISFPTYTAACGTTSLGGGCGVPKGGSALSLVVHVVEKL